MDKSSVREFLKENKGKFRSAHYKYVSRLLFATDEKTFAVVKEEGFDDPSIVLFISFLIGYTGVDRFFIGHRKLGLLKLFGTITLLITGYILSITKFEEDPGFTYTWAIIFFIIGSYWIAGMIRIYREVKNYNFKKLKKILSSPEHFS